MSGVGWYLWGSFFALLIPWTVFIVVMAVRSITAPISAGNDALD